MYNVLQTYVDLLKEKCLSSNKMLTRLELNGLWVNFMKKVEYNPPHHHDGDISCVIYSSIPSEILEKKKIFKGRGSAPGDISFIYGERNETFKTEFSFAPKERNVYLFHASLRHFVAPFKSNVIKESVSGNITFKYA